MAAASPPPPPRTDPVRERPIRPRPLRRALQSGAGVLSALLVLSACGPETPATDEPPPPPPVPGAPILQDLALEGEQLFRRKGCLACHKVQGGRAVGPDLAGVTDRREWPWFRGMVSNPDSMLSVDPVAIALLQEYRTRMVRQTLTEREIRALWEHLRRFPGLPESQAEGP